jgi:hypothetical protein
MAGPDAISIEDFRALVARSVLTLSDEQMEVLRPLYDHYAGLTALLHGLELGAEDLAVTFSAESAFGDQVVG